MCKYRISAPSCCSTRYRITAPRDASHSRSMPAGICSIYATPRARRCARTHANSSKGSKRLSPLRIVRRLAGHRDVVDMALAQTRRGDLHETAILLHVGDSLVAGVAHRRAQAADKLVNDVADRPLVRHAAFDPFRHQLQRRGHFLLEIAV